VEGEVVPVISADPEGVTVPVVGTTAGVGTLPV
jgi:hypothetical protein